MENTRETAAAKEPSFARRIWNNIAGRLLGKSFDVYPELEMKPFPTIVGMDIMPIFKNLNRTLAQQPENRAGQQSEYNSLMHEVDRRFDNYINARTKHNNVTDPDINEITMIQAMGFLGDHMCRDYSIVGVSKKDEPNINTFFTSEFMRLAIHRGHLNGQLFYEKCDKPDLNEGRSVWLGFKPGEGSVLKDTVHFEQKPITIEGTDGIHTYIHLYSSNGADIRKIEKTYTGISHSTISTALENRKYKYAHVMKQLNPAA